MTARSRPLTTIRAGAVALTAALLVLAATVTATPPSDPARVVVGALRLDAAVSAIRDAGGAVLDRFDEFGLLVAELPDPGRLAADPRVTSVEADTALAPQGQPETSDDPAPASTTAPQTVNADDLWAEGITGGGVGVAVIDTGVDRNKVLHDRLVASVDVSSDHNGQDMYGHGTFVAGLVAGAPVDGPGGFSGVAPGAHLVSIRVADRDGDATLSGVIAGLAAADRAREVFGVRVVLLAAGGPPVNTPDALELALRQLWARGMVVVVPAGNTPGEVASPGVDPYLITAGAFDDHGTADPGDDTAADFSGTGTDVHGRSKPDVLAPGVSVVSARAKGSLIDRENPDSRIGAHLFRGSGTSMAAAVTAGAAALLLDADPALTPDEVKGRLTAAGGDAPPHLDVAAAVAATDAPPANQDLPPIELVEGEPDGDGTGPDGHSWVGHSWVGHSWVGHSWVDEAWVGHSWVGHSWVGHSWVDDTWVGHSWVGHSWVGHSWVGHSWVGHSWVGVDWDTG